MTKARFCLPSRGFPFCPSFSCLIRCRMGPVWNPTLDWAVSHLQGSCLVIEGLHHARCSWTCTSSTARWSPPGQVDGLEMVFLGDRGTPQTRWLSFFGVPFQPAEDPARPKQKVFKPPQTPGPAPADPKASAGRPWARWCLCPALRRQETKRSEWPFWPGS